MNLRGLINLYPLETIILGKEWVKNGLIIEKMNGFTLLWKKKIKTLSEGMKEFNILAFLYYWCLLLLATVMLLKHVSYICYIPSFNPFSTRKIEKLSFWDPNNSTTLKLRIASAKSINLHTFRKLIKYSFEAFL